MTLVQIMLVVRDCLTFVPHCSSSLLSSIPRPCFLVIEGEMGGVAVLRHYQGAGMLVQYTNLPGIIPSNL